jgi:hypothetical protein
LGQTIDIPTRGRNRFALCLWICSDKPVRGHGSYVI